MEPARVFLLLALAGAPAVAEVPEPTPPDPLATHEQDPSATRNLLTRMRRWRERGGGASHRAGRRLLRLADLRFEEGAMQDAAELFAWSARVLALTQGAEDIALAEPLSGQAHCLWELGALDEATDLHTRALRIRETRLGPDHVDVAINLNGLARILQDQGNFADAMPVFERALAIRETALAPDHPDLAGSVTSLAYLLLTKGDAAAALPMAERALAIRTRSRGARHAETGTSLDFLGRVHQNLGDYPRARELYRQALAVRQEALGADHPYVAITVNNLARLLYELGELDEAERLFLDALESLERSYGPDNPSLAAALDNLGTVVWALGDLDRALGLFTRALAIRERNLGADHFEVATTLSSIAVVHRSRGDYAAAREAAERALDIDRRSLGERHPYTLAAANNLAVLLHHQGDFQAAQALYEEVVAAAEAELGPDHPDLLTHLHNLATAASSAGNHPGARALYVRVLEREEELLGPMHADVATTLDHLAQELLEAGEAPAAIPLLERSLAIRLQTVGRHPDMARTRRALALAARENGDLDAALAHAEEALALQEQTLGQAHPHMDETLVLLASLRLERGDARGARQDLDRGLSIAETGLDLIDTLSEREALELAASSRRTFDAWLTLFDGAGDREAAYDGVLRWKGAATRRLLRRREFVAGDLTSVEALTESLAETRSQIAQLFLDATIGPEDRRERAASLTREKERLERAIASEALSSRDEIHARAPTSRSVCASLPSGAALVDILSHQRDGQGHYVAFVLRQTASCVPIRVELGPAEHIDDAVVAWRKPYAATWGTRSVPLVSGARPPSAVDTADEDLTSYLWKPLAALLQDVESVFIVPDGALASLPFGALRTGPGGLLLESHRVSMLDHATDLLRANVAPGRGLLVVADVDFDGDVVRDTEVRSRMAACVERAFLPLDGTAIEAEAIKSRWVERPRSGPSVVLTGLEATEQALARAIVGHEIVHIATHGYFGTERCRAGTGAGDLAGFNPMVLSGLALAGANDVGGAALGDDAILTAEEVSALDLRGTRLVVLSACDTGLGEVRSGEGVLGMRRAFAFAGAAAQVTSLWSVPDKATARLMTAFYSGLLDHGLPVAEALRRAQLEELARAREERGDEGLRDWAAFVVTGR